jgi:hypothetical protein
MFRKSISAQLPVLVAVALATAVTVGKANIIVGPYPGGGAIGGIAVLPPPGTFFSLTEPIAIAVPIPAVPIVIEQMQLGGINPPAPVPLPGGTFDSFFDIFTEISLDGGTTWEGNRSFHIEIEALPQSGSVTPFELSVLGFDPVPITASAVLRLDPNRPSTGQITFTEIGGGLYQVDSFFDIFTELSVDGGNTWIPSSAPLHLEMLPEPSTVLLSALGSIAIGVAAFYRRRRRA